MVFIGDYVNSKEYRKPEWVTRMEEIQKRLAGETHKDIRNKLINNIKPKKSGLFHNILVCLGHLYLIIPSRNLVTLDLVIYAGLG